MILSNEAVLLLIGFIGIASIVIFVITENYNDTIQSVAFLTESKQNALSEIIGILDIQTKDDTVFVMLVNHSISNNNVTITKFWDKDGNDISGMCQDSKGAINGTRYTIPMDTVVTISCTFTSPPHDIALLTENYNVIYISAQQ